MISIVVAIVFSHAINTRGIALYSIKKLESKERILVLQPNALLVLVIGLSGVLKSAFSIGELCYQIRLALLILLLIVL